MRLSTKRIICIALSVILVIGLTACGSKKEKIITSLTACGEKYGLSDITVIVPELRSGYTDYIEVYGSNFKELAWDDVFLMYREMESQIGNDHVSFKENREGIIVLYSIWENTNNIIEDDNNIRITYAGSWDAFDSEDSREHNLKVSEGLHDTTESMRDEQIGVKKCDICGKTSTKRIDDEYYCDEHYEDAQNYYREQSQK